MNCTPVRFRTDRLIVDEWHSLSPTDEDLAESVMAILTPVVSKSLPDGWQGEYSEERAAQWINKRDQESPTMLILDRSSKKPIGLMIVFITGDEPIGRVVRVGYMLTASVWGQGIGTELLRGFVDWCKTAEVSSIIGGVAGDNIASRRVMEKAGFVIQPGNASDSELFYRLDIL